MADSFFDVARELRKNPGVRLVTKGSQWDRAYVENDTLEVSREHPTFPQDASGTLRERCTPGTAHPKCKYLILTDAYVTGGSDDKQNWQFIYRLDLRAFYEANPGIAASYEALLAEDGVITQYPAQDDSPEITWTFSIVNPAGYTRAAQGTPYPTNANALLISEQSQRDGQVLTVTRVYHKVAPLDAQSKIGYQILGEYIGFSIVTWSYECKKADYTPPTTATTCPIAGYTALKVIRPPDTVAAQNTENLRITITYGALPGPLISTPAVGDGPAGDVVRNTQRQATSAGSPAGPWLDFQATEQNGFSKVWNWVTLTSNPVFSDYDFDPDTQDTVTTSRQIVLESSVPTRPLGSDVSQRQMNPYYALRTTRSIAGTPSSYTMLAWLNFSTPDINKAISGTTGDGDTWIVNYIRRGGFNKKLKGKVVTEFFANLPAPQDVLQILPSGQVYNGYHFSFSMRGTLVDAVPAFGSSGGSYVETVDIEPSEPTATEFLDLIDSGDYQLISEETVRFWSKHYMRRSYFVILE